MIKVKVTSEEGTETETEGTVFFGVMLHPDRPGYWSTLLLDSINPPNYEDVAKVVGAFIRSQPEYFQKMILEENLIAARTEEVEE